MYIHAHTLIFVSCGCTHMQMLYFNCACKHPEMHVYIHTCIHMCTPSHRHPEDRYIHVCTYHAQNHAAHTCTGHTEHTSHSQASSTHKYSACTCMHICNIHMEVPTPMCPHTRYITHICICTHVYTNTERQCTNMHAYADIQTCSHAHTWQTCTSTHTIGPGEVPRASLPLPLPALE